MGKIVTSRRNVKSIPIHSGGFPNLSALSDFFCNQQIWRKTEAFKSGKYVLPVSLVKMNVQKWRNCMYLNYN